MDLWCGGFVEPGDGVGVAGTSPTGTPESTNNARPKSNITRVPTRANCALLNYIKDIKDKDMNVFVSASS